MGFQRTLLCTIILLTATKYYALVCEAQLQKIIHISPTAQFNNSCSSPCYTLLQLYQQHTYENGSIIGSNTTLSFLGGEHVIETEVPEHMIITDVENLMLASNVGARIVCKKPFGFAFLNITNLTLQNLSIVDCGTKLSKQLVQDTFTLQIVSMFKIRIQPNVALFAVNIHSLTMSTVTVRNSSGYGLLGINIIGNSKLLLARFLQNNNISYNHCWTMNLNSSDANNCRGGNALFIYTDLHECPTLPFTPTTFNLTLIQNTFYRGIDLVEGVYDPGYVTLGSGLGVTLFQLHYGVRVRLIQSETIGNIALTGGANLFFRIYGTVVNSSFIIQDTQCLYGYEILSPPPVGGDYVTGQGPALLFTHGIFDSRKMLKCTQDIRKCSRVPRHEEVLIIENSSFSNNFGGAVMTQLSSGYQAGNACTVPATHAVIIRNSNITRNTVIPKNYVPVFWMANLNKIARKAELVIVNSKIAHNKVKATFTMQDANSYISDNYPVTSIVRFSSISNVTILNCSFVNNTFSSTIHAVNSFVYFKRNNVFAFNAALFGGALYLTKDSVIFLESTTQLIFEHNSAIERGGAVYVADGKFFEDDLVCFFQIYDTTSKPLSDYTTEMRFINNTAVLAGDAVYGGNIQRCFNPSPSAFLLQNSTVLGHIIFDYITNFTGQQQSNSVISSDAVKLCFCFNNQRECGVTYITLSKYPGERFHFSVIGIGQRGGVTPTVVTTLVGSTGVENLQKIGRDCNNVQYQITSNHTSTREYMLVFADTLTLETKYLFIVIDLLPCPVGFGLDDTRSCKCSPLLKQRNITKCDIDTRVITRVPPYWLSNYSQHLIIYDHCPFDYCKPTDTQITMQEPNISKQCAFNRTGTICGQCKQGFSFVFGTSRCIQCSNKYIALVVPFALAGITLIVFLLFLNLTVSVGTINGLIFYANIVKINEAIFFLPGDNSLLKVFISWVNLDLGLETCFYNGMDSYVKTWLQLVFPLYMWLILIIILIVSRYSMTVVKLCGNYTVPVLATIFLLSFTKILRVIITALSFTTIDYPDGTRVLWLYDGSVQFGKHKHLGLLLFAIIFLVALLPYTILLTTVQLLRKWSHKNYLKWVSKLMPVFDAYVGPYKNKYAYWSGFCLLVRVVLVLVFSFNIFGDPAVNLLAIILVVFAVIILNLSQGGVYKRNYLTALELSFMINLAVLAVVTGYVRQTGGSQSSVINTSTSITLITFILILIYHCYTKLHKKCAFLKDRTFFKSRKVPIAKELTEPQTDSSNQWSQNNARVTKTIVEIPTPPEDNEFREPLLEESDSAQ